MAHEPIDPPSNGTIPPSDAPPNADTARPKSKSDAPPRRKSITQTAREDRERTKRWRAERKARRVPEAAQVDKAVLEALLHRAKRGRTMLIDETAFAEAMQIAIRLLVRRRADPQEAVAAIQRRLSEFDKGEAVKEMLRREEFDRRNPPVPAEGDGEHTP